MDFEFVAGEFAQHISQPVNFTEDGITFIAEIVSGSAWMCPERVITPNLRV